VRLQGGTRLLDKQRKLSYTWLDRPLRVAPSNIQLSDEVEQNIVICQWWADQLFYDAEGMIYKNHVNPNYGR
jgi:hypothetical protein